MSQKPQKTQQKNTNNQDPKIIQSKLIQKVEKNCFDSESLNKLITMHLKKEANLDIQQFSKYYLSYLNMCGQQEEKIVANLKELINITEENQQEQIQILQLFEDIFIIDYYYIIGKLWMNFAQQLFQKNLIGINKLKSIIEKNLIKFQYSYILGSKVFKRSRKIFKKVVQYQEEQKKPEKTIQDNKKYIIQLFLRELKIPLERFEMLFNQFEDFQEKNEGLFDEDTISQIEKSYNETEKKLPHFVEIENNFKDAIENEKLQLEFLDELIEIDGLNPQIIQAYFERAILISQEQKQDNLDKIYEKYVQFAEKCLNQIEQAPILKRYLKKCTKNETDLKNYQLYLLKIEKINRDPQELLEDCKHLQYYQRNSLENQFLLYKMQIEMFSRLQIFVREIDDKETKLQAEKYFENLFDLALGNFYRLSFFFQDNLKQDCNNYQKLLMLQKAQLECYLFRDALKMRKTMENTVKYFGQEGEIWQEYHKMELALGNIPQARNALKRGLNKISEKQEEFLEFYLEFEKYFGTQEQFQQINEKWVQKVEEEYKKVQNELKELEEKIQIEEEQDENQNQKQDKIEKDSLENDEISSFEEEMEKNYEDQGEDQESDFDSEEFDDEEMVQQFLKKQEQKQLNLQQGIKKEVTQEKDVNNLNQKRKAHELSEDINNGENMDKLQKKQKQTNQKETDELLNKKDISNENKKQQNIHQNPPINPENENVVFVKNLPLEYEDQADIYNLIESEILKAKEIKAVRLIKNKKQVPKGIAYIDCTTDQGVQDIVQILNNKKVGDKVLFAAKSEPPKKAFNADHITLFLNNLPYSITDEKLRNKLPELKIKEIRIIRDQQGKPRGYCYIEFQDEENLEKAREILKNDPFIDSRKIIIQKSDSQTNIKKKQNNVVFIKGLPFKLRESDLVEFFHGLNIKQMTLVKDKNNRPKGLAYVEFENEIDMKTALELTDPQLKGRTLTILKSDREITFKKKEQQEKERNFDKIEKKSNSDFAQFLK